MKNTGFVCETEEEQRALVGRRVLVAHNDNSGGATPTGWHVGRVRFFGVSSKQKEVCETANFVLRYTKKETNGEIKEGLEEPRELSARNYGCDEWWVLLDPLAATQ